MPAYKVKPRKKMSVMLLVMENAVGRWTVLYFYLRLL